MEEQPTSAGAQQQAAAIPPAPATDAEDGGKSGAAKIDRMPRTHAEWTAFAALPPTERAEAYIRSLRSMTAVFATLAVAGPLAVAIFAMPSTRTRTRPRSRTCARCRWPAAVAQLGR